MIVPMTMIKMAAHCSLALEFGHYRMFVVYVDPTGCCGGVFVVCDGRTGCHGGVTCYACCYGVGAGGGCSGHVDCIGVVDTGGAPDPPCDLRSVCYVLVVAHV